jgi:signal transduction histidine kinase
MKKIYTGNFRIFFILLSCLILRGYDVSASNEPLNPNPDIEQDIQGKTIDQIFFIANKYSYTNLNIALKYANRAIEIAKASGNLEDIFNAQRGLAFIYEDNSLAIKAIEVHVNNIEIAKKLDNDALASVYNDIAILNRKAGNFREAYNWYDKTLELARSVKDTINIESSLHGIGLLQKEVGLYDKAIANLLESLNYAVALNSTRDIIVSENDIADTYMKAQEVDKALEHIERAYQLALQQFNNANKDEEATGQLARALSIYGTILVLKKDFQGALKKQEEALKIYTRFNLKTHIANALIQIASIYLDIHNYPKAKEILDECLQYESSATIRNRSELYSKLGIYYIETNNLALAEKFFLKSLSQANKYDFKDISQKVNYQLFLINFNNNNNKKAIQYLNAAQALNDSLFNAAKSKRTAEAEFKFDNERRDNEIQALKLKENDSKLRANSVLLIASVVLFVMIVLFLGYTIKMRGKNLQAMQVKSDEIQQQYRKLEESNEILSQFAYVAAHDLKEPLRSIGSYIGLIQMRYSKDLPDDAKDYMKFVNSGVKRMYSLLTDLLDFSQVISQQPSSELIRPNEILSDVRDNLRSAIEAKNAQIIYKTDMPNVRMNRLHMTQLFQNLIGNALKFTDIDPVVKVEAREENGCVVLTIEDNGIGIKKEYAGKVFVLFQQLNKKEQFEGTGIGLTICKNIVEKYNGRIWFDSEENKGTKFYISIPSAQVA